MKKVDVDAVKVFILRVSNMMLRESCHASESWHPVSAE